MKIKNSGEILINDHKVEENTILDINPEAYGGNEIQSPLNYYFDYSIMINDTDKYLLDWTDKVLLVFFV